MWDEDENLWWLKGNGGRDQTGSTCFWIFTMGSRQKIDYGAETLIRCLSPLSLPQTEHPPRTTILHPLTSFPDHLINNISSTPHKALCTPSLLRLCARRMSSSFFSPMAAWFPTFQCFSRIYLPTFKLPSLAAPSAVLDTSPSYIPRCSWLVGWVLAIGKQEWLLSSQSSIHYSLLGNMFVTRWMTILHV